LRVAFFGTPDLAVPYLEALVESPHEVCVVVTQPDRVAGRGRDLRSPPVKSAAQRRGLCVLQPADCGEEWVTVALAGCAPEIGVVVAYGQILPPALLGCPSQRCLNVHYSLLPALRGAAPVQHALLEGLTETGVTLQWMSEELDAGDIILQERVAIEPEDNQATLFERLTTVGVPLLLQALDPIAAGIAPRTAQDPARATWAPELTTSQCRIDWSQPAERVRNLVRACNPRPGAYALRGGRRLKVLSVEVVKQMGRGEGGPPGSFVELDAKGRPVVRAGEGTVALVEVQPEGRRVMSGADFARGAKLSAGERLA